MASFYHETLTQELKQKRRFCPLTSFVQMTRIKVDRETPLAPNFSRELFLLDNFYKFQLSQVTLDKALYCLRIFFSRISFNLSLTQLGHTEGNIQQIADLNRPMLFRHL